MRSAGAALLLFAASCSPNAAGAPTGQRAGIGTSIVDGAVPTRLEAPPPQAKPPPGYRPDPRAAPPRVTTPSDMARMLAAVRHLEVPGRPCLERDWPRRELGRAELRRLKAMQAAASALRTEVMSRIPERLLSADLDFGIDGTAQPRFVIKVRGHEPLPELWDGVQNVPIMIEYGVPHDFENLRKLFSLGARRTSEVVPKLNGSALRAEGYGYKRLYVQGPGGRVNAAVLARCEDLRAANGMPVLIRFEDAGPPSTG